MSDENPVEEPPVEQPPVEETVVDEPQPRMELSQLKAVIEALAFASQTR